MLVTELGPMSWGCSWKLASTSRKFFEPGGLKPRPRWSTNTTTSPSLGVGGFSGPGTLQWMTSFLAKAPVLTRLFNYSWLHEKEPNCIHRLAWPWQWKIWNMIIAGLRFTVDNYTALWGYKHIDKPDLVICKPESDNGNDVRHWRFNRGLMVSTGSSFFLWS